MPRTLSRFCAINSVTLHIAIIGVGGVGYHAILLADKIFNVEKITAIDILEARLSLADKAGATGTFVWPSAENIDIAKKVKEEASGLGHDAVYDFVGTNSSIEFATRIARRGGRVVIVGISSDPFNAKISSIQFREISLITSIQHTKTELEEILNFVQNGKIDLSHSVTARVPLTSAKEAITEFIDVKERRPDSVRTIFVP